VPAVVGTPEITPVEALIFNPAGSEPETIENVYPGTPPITLSAAEYDAPTLV